MFSTKRQVLIFGNREDINTFTEKLTSQGYQCTMTFDNDDTMTKMALQEFNIVLLGTGLVGISGLEASKKIRSKHHKNATLIMANANAIDIATRVLNLEVSDKVIKPSNLDEVNNHDKKFEVEDAWKWFSEKSDYRGLPSSLRVKNSTKTTEDDYLNMDAIARGVEVRYDLSIGWSNMIIQKSVDIARMIEIHEEVICEWMASKKAVYLARNKKVENALQKLKQSKSAQLILRITEQDLYPSHFYVSLN